MSDEMNEEVKPYTTLAEVEADVEVYDRNFYRVTESHEHEPGTRVHTIRTIYERLLATARAELGAAHRQEGGR